MVNPFSVSIAKLLGENALSTNTVCAYKATAYLIPYCLKQLRSGGLGRAEPLALNPQQ